MLAISTMATKCKTNILETKYKANLEVEKGLKTKTQIATDFDVPLNTLSTWLKNTRKLTRPKALVHRTRGCVLWYNPPTHIHTHHTHTPHTHTKVSSPEHNGHCLPKPSV